MWILEEWESLFCPNRQYEKTNVKLSTISLWKQGSRLLFQPLWMKYFMYGCLVRWKNCCMIIKNVIVRTFPCLKLQVIFPKACRMCLQILIINVISYCLDNLSWVSAKQSGPVWFGMVCMFQCQNLGPKMDPFHSAFMPPLRKGTKCTHLTLTVVCLWSSGLALIISTYKCSMFCTELNSFLPHFVINMLKTETAIKFLTQLVGNCPSETTRVLKRPVSVMGHVQTSGF